MADKLRIIATSATTIALLYIYREEIKTILQITLKSFANQIYIELEIKRSGNEKIVYAIMQELEKNYKNCRQSVVRQGNNDVFYTLPQGTYYIWRSWRPVFVTVTEDKITLWCLGRNINYLKTMLEELYVPDNKVDDVLFFYLSYDDKWSVPLYRRPRKNIKITKDMQLLLDDVEDFYKKKDEYENEGWAYRRGYFVEGAPGTGKSAMVELLSKKYHMCVYLINLNSDKMTDATLISLLSNVPPGSLIVFDEFDNQYEAIQANPNIHISNSGILQAIDGAQRLSHGTIVLVTINDRTKFPANFLAPLLRLGRLDKSFVFN